MSNIYNLTGGGPWGFRLVGGQDFRMDLSVSKVTAGGKAERAGIKSGMKLLEINGSNTKGMTHLEAQNAVKSAGSVLKLALEALEEVKTDDFSPKTLPAPAVTSSVSSVRKPTNDFVRPPPVTAPVTESQLPPPPPSMLTPEIKETTNQADPICEGCKKVIHGPYLSHQGKSWHIDEFVCAASNCRKPLQNIGFIEENGERYCKDCYEKHFAHVCGKCHKKIIGEIMHALNQTWHMTCFVCTACNQTFQDGVFQMQDNHPYCIADYNRLFSQTCKGCSFVIEAGDHYLEALNSQWHESCFQCAVCHCDLRKVGFFNAGGKPVCSNHRNARVA